MMHLLRHANATYLGHLQLPYPPATSSAEQSSPKCIDLYMTKACASPQDMYTPRETQEDEDITLNTKSPTNNLGTIAPRKLNLDPCPAHPSQPPYALTISARNDHPGFPVPSRGPSIDPEVLPIRPACTRLYPVSSWSDIASRGIPGEALRRSMKQVHDSCCSRKAARKTATTSLSSLPMSGAVEK